jgi:predicted nucleic acid-binding protein
MIILVDTNILLDVLHDRKPFAEPAARVWKAVEEGAVTGHVSAISFNNIFYVARKRDGAAKALDALRLVRADFRIVPLDEVIIDQAFATTERDFEDAIQAAAALRIAADFIVTRNVDDFRSAGVKAITAKDLLSILQP